MENETAVADSSSAETTSTPVGQPITVQEPERWKEMDVSRGPLVDITPEQRTEFRRTGKLPEAPKKEEAAPSPEAQKAETSPASEAANKQQEKTAKPKQTAEDRIAQLESTIEKIRKGAGIEKAEPKPESKQQEQPKNGPQPPQNYKDWFKTFDPDKWVEDFAKANPESTYERANAAMADFLGDARDHFRNMDQQRESQQKEFTSKVDEAKGRYGDKFDEVISPTVNAIVSDPAIAGSVKARLDKSKILPDLLFTIGSDPKTLASFQHLARTDEWGAIDYIVLTESLIHEELDSNVKPDTPAKPQTNAPKPPSEVGGRATTPGDELESAAKANDFRAFKAEANRRALAKLKT